MPAATLAGVLGVIAAASLTLQAALAAGAAVGQNTLVSWGMALFSILVGVVGAIRNRSREIPVLALIALGLPVVATLGVAVVMPELVFPVAAWLAFSAIGYALATAMVQWGGNLRMEASRWVSRPQSGSPVPSGLVMGLVFFSVPSDRWVAAGLAVPFFGSLLALAGLGSAVRRLQAERGALVSRQTPVRWGLALALALLLAGLLGSIAPAMTARRQNLLAGLAQKTTLPLGVQVGNAGGTEGNAPRPSFRGENLAPKTRKDPNAKLTEEVPVQGVSTEPPKAARQGPPEPPPTPTPQEQRETAKKSRTLALLVAAGAAVLMFLVARYGERVAAWIKRWRDRLVAKWQASREARRAASVAAQRETAIAQILHQQTDPFRDIAQLGDADLYASMEAWITALGVERRPGETASTYVVRAANALNLDRRPLDQIVRTTTEWAYGGVTPTATAREATRAALASVVATVSGRVAADALSERQTQYRRNVAEQEFDLATREARTS